MSIVWTIYAKNGGCRHASALTAEQLITTARLNWISQPLCVSGLTTCKISVACLILRLQYPTPWRTKLLVSLLSVMVTINSIAVILMFTQCTPVRMLWDPASAPNGHCIKSNVVSIISQSASSNGLPVMLTWYLLTRLQVTWPIVPVHMIWKLQMNKKKKVAICVLLSTGVSAFGFAVIKIVELKNDANHSDITWATVWLFVWNAFEINLIIIAACIPTLIPLLEIILNHRVASYFNSYKTNHGGSKFSFHKESFRMRRLNSSNNDTESGKDILGIKNSINGDSGELGVVEEESEEICGNKNTDRIVSQGKISVTRQWSVTELK
ncbi:hypothetical protein BGAL_0479g00020 [Botrytis galanthina]|uniref:Rhodopsin domain-containing protein n=1 Tax=Botrytis galanthina TaxID=278940 RepID=A0A4V4HTK4_9HELO|nr:hypothetical protein BGAL_0479g00020 [Botrytis galanthina]